MLETDSTKAIAVGESENVGDLGTELLAAGDRRGFGGGLIDTAAILQLFFSKYAFLAYLGLNFCLKLRF